MQDVDDVDEDVNTGTAGHHADDAMAHACSSSQCIYANMLHGQYRVTAADVDEAGEAGEKLASGLPQV